jgi:DNA-binding transcriptional ArsR family regulator
MSMAKADLAVRFAALGDPRRLALLEDIAGGGAVSITALASGSDITRQAITRHLCVLEDAGLVRGSVKGREHLWSLDDAEVAAVQAELARLAGRWRQRLARLKRLVEGDPLASP